MFETYINFSVSEYKNDSDFSNIFVYHYHPIMELDEEDWFSEKFKKNYFAQIASQFHWEKNDVILNLQFNGVSIVHDSTFSTDISESCHWLTPFVKQPDDWQDLW